jgi:hypothetical protein
MKTLTINLPDSIDINQERQFLAIDWYRLGKLSAVQAADVAGVSVSIFLSIAEPLTKEDQLLKKMVRPVVKDFDKTALEQASRQKKLDWGKLDQLADQVSIDGDTEELLAQIGK